MIPQSSAHDEINATASWSTRTNTRSRWSMAAGASPHPGVKRSRRIPRTRGYGLPPPIGKICNCTTVALKCAKLHLLQWTQLHRTPPIGLTPNHQKKPHNSLGTSALCTSKTCTFESIALCTKNPPIRSETLAHPQVFLPGKVRRFKCDALNDCISSRVALICHVLFNFHRMFL